MFYFVLLIISLVLNVFHTISSWFSCEWILWFGRNLYTLLMHHNSWIKHQQPVLCFTTPHVNHNSPPRLNKSCQTPSVNLCDTEGFPTAAPRFLLRPDRGALSGRFVLLTEPFKKQGGRAVAMAAPEERRRSWHQTAWHRHCLPLTQAYHRPTDRRLHPSTLGDHSHRAWPVSTKGLIP